MNSGFTSIEGKCVTNTAYVDKTERDGAGKAEIPLWLKSELPAEQVLVCATPVQPSSFFFCFFPQQEIKPLVSRSQPRHLSALGSDFVLPGVALFLWSDAARDFSRGTLQVQFLGLGCNP